MTSNKGWDGVELLQVVESLSKEKSISKESLFIALEETIRSVARKQYGHTNSLNVIVDRNTGDIKVYSELIVISDEEMNEILNGISSQKIAELAEDGAANKEENDRGGALLATAPQNELGADADLAAAATAPVTDMVGADAADEEEFAAAPAPISDPSAYIALSDAQAINAAAQIGDCIQELLPKLDLSRIAIQSAKSTLTAKVIEIQREIEQKNCQHRIGEIFSGIVIRVDRIGAYIQTNHGEAVIKKEHMLRSDHFKSGDRIKACLIEIDPQFRGPQLILSRTTDQFLAQLMHSEIPEIYNKIISIMGIVREPGSRSKVAVHSNDSSIDAVGSCIGVKGSRIKAIMAEIGGEKIDLVHWSNNHVQYAINALHPIQAHKIIVDEEKHSIEIIIDDINLSSAIGRRGQNIRLISRMLGWSVTVNTESNESVKRSSEFTRSTASLVHALDIEEILAQLLIAEGYDSVQKIAAAEIATIAGINGLDQEIAEELIVRAQEHLASESENQENNPNHPGAGAADGQDDRLRSANPGSRAGGSEAGSAHGGTPDLLSKDILRALSSNGIKTIYDIAALSADELMEILQNSECSIQPQTAHKVIATARDKAYFNVLRA